MNFEIILFLVHALIVLGKPAHQDEGMSFTVKHAGMKKKISHQWRSSTFCI